MKGHPVKSGDTVNNTTRWAITKGSMKGRPLRGGDLTTGTAELITDELPR